MIRDESLPGGNDFDRLVSLLSSRPNRPFCCDPGSGVSMRSLGSQRPIKTFFDRIALVVCCVETSSVRVAWGYGPSPQLHEGESSRCAEPVAFRAEALDIPQRCWSCVGSRFVILESHMISA